MRQANGQVALVTGANKGIGFEIARQLGRAGYTVLLGARNPELGRIATARLSDEQRAGVPDDVGPMIATLPSDENRGVNAQRIEVSGGMAL
jgi:NAD(P)-dependent dehydrogenase (short-subunit alcohol dehydrogenase family)